MTTANQPSTAAVLSAGAGDGQFFLSGELSFATVVGLLPQSQQFLGAGSPVVDLSGVSHADSAGLALLIEWLRQARLLGQTLRYSGVPRQLQALAGISDLETLLAAP